MYEHILLTLDGSDLAESAIPHAETLAIGCGTKKVTIVHVIQHGTYYKLAVAGRRPATYLRGIAKRLEDKGIKTEVEVLAGDPAEEIVSYADKTPCDIIIMASHGRSGVTRWAIGSVADKVFRASRVPILMVRASNEGPGT